MLQALLLILFFYLVGKAYRAVRGKLGIQPKIKSDEEKERSKLRVSWFIIAGIVVLILTFGYSTYKNTSDTPQLTPITSVGVQEPTPQPVPEINTSRLLELTNNERASAGLGALTVDDRLNQSALDKCNDMVARNYQDHVAPDGTSYKDFMHKYISSAQLAGENLAFGYFSSDNIFNAWMASPSHKDNIDKPIYTRVGFALCERPNGAKLVVQHFMSAY